MPSPKLLCVMTQFIWIFAYFLIWTTFQIRCFIVPINLSSRNAIDIYKHTYIYVGLKRIHNQVLHASNDETMATVIESGGQNLVLGNKKILFGGDLSF